MQFAPNFKISWQHFLCKPKFFNFQYVEWREHNSAIKSVLDGSWQPSNEIIQGMKYEVTGFDFEGRPG